MKKIPVAVLGCRGVVGQQFIRMLDHHPFFTVDTIVASSESVGSVYGKAGEWALNGGCPQYVREMTIQKFDASTMVDRGVKAVFSALPAPVAGQFEGILRDEKMFVFSNASAYRMKSDVPIIIPEVNADHIGLIRRQVLKYGGGIITNSNCSTAGLVIALRPILNYGIRWVAVSTYQAISGAGLNGIPAMRITGNILPYIQNEEEKMESESKKILGQFQNDHIKNLDLPFYISCCRVPVISGHLQNVVIEFDQNVDIPDLIDAWKKYRGRPQKANLPTAPAFPIVVREEPDRPQPILDCDAGFPKRARGMAITIGRIRKTGNNIRFFLLVHNTIRGAAGSSLLNAEMAFASGILS